MPVQRCAGYAELAARPLANGEAPFRGEQPDPVREVPRRRNDADDVRRHRPGIHEFLLHFPEGGVIVLHQLRAREAHGVYVIADVKEGEDAGPTLRRVQPVAAPGIFSDVGVAAIPDVNAVQRVIEQRQKDEQPLHPMYEGQAGQKLYLIVIRLRAFHRFGVGDEVLNQECADGHDARERMQTPQEERVAFARTQRSYSFRDPGGTGFNRTGR